MKVRIPATNVAELLGRRSMREGDKPALVEADRSLSWAELDEQVHALARGLTDLGTVAGHRVGIVMGNSIEFVVTYLAVLRCGLVAVPINPTSRVGEIARVVADSGARVCFADEETCAQVRAAVRELDDLDSGGDRTRSEPTPAPLLVVTGATALDGETPYADLSIGGPVVSSPLDPESLAVLLYTSGTSGQPRAAMLSHRALLANIDQTSRTRPSPLLPDDVVLGVLPLFHVYGLNAVLGQVLLQGATLVLGRRFDPEETLDLVQTSQVTSVPVAPPVIASWLQRDDIADRLTSVRVLLSGAAPLSAELSRSFEEKAGIPIEQGYGLTEAAPIVTSTIGTDQHKPGSSGRALPGVELRVVDEAGRDVDPDDPGEIWVRGRNLFSGYWPDGDDSPGADGWLATGDIGFLDGDGDLFLVDRLKEMVIVSGFNVYPSEIEDVISEVAGVRECAVIGVPDEATGEGVEAYVVAAPDAGPELAAAVGDHCVARLARFKIPSAVHIVDKLPHSVTGKVAKGRLRANQARRAMGLS